MWPGGLTSPLCLHEEERQTERVSSGVLSIQLCHAAQKSPEREIAQGLDTRLELHLMLKKKRERESELGRSTLYTRCSLPCTQQHVGWA